MNTPRSISIPLDNELNEGLDRLAALTQRSPALIAAEAIRDYLARNETEVAEIRRALAEADAGDFAGEDEVAALARKWR